MNTILAICGSLRKHSKNLELLKFAQTAVPEGMQIIIADISGLPFFNEDIEANPPQVVQDFLKQVEDANGFLFGCPEYNYSIAPALKNALDWASRAPKNILLNNKPAGIVGSGGGMGTSRAQYHLRQVGVCLNLRFVNKPEVFCNGFIGTFDENNELVDERIKQTIQALLVELNSML